MSPAATSMLQEKTARTPHVCVMSTTPYVLFLCYDAALNDVEGR